MAVMIPHIVFFRLKHADGSAEEFSFLNDLQELANLPMVTGYQRPQLLDANSEHRCIDGV
jgi:hypothetical protein